MVRKLFILIFFVFGLSVFSVSLWRANASTVTPEADSSSSAEMKEMETQMESDVEVSADYSLPYPGLLPDHPLYFLKMIRDRIQLWLTRNPTSRARLLLHYADKRMAAALVLAENGKSGLAVSTAMKASQYLERSAMQVETLSDESEKQELSDTLIWAVSKHAQVLLGIESRIPNEAKGGLHEVNSLHERVEEQLVGEEEEKMEGEMEGSDLEEEVMENEDNEDIEMKSDEHDDATTEEE